MFFCISRIYTGIHALKPKPKSKTGAISESTTALNVDQSNNLVLGVDEKNSVSGPPALPLPVPVPVPSSLAASATFTKGQDQQTSTTETGVSGSAPATTQKKEGSGLAKVQADKKKMDARKKSLKRL